MPKQPDPHKVEQAKTLQAMGKTDTAIGKIMGVHRTTARRWIDMDDPPEIAAELAIARQEQVRRFVERAWPLIHGLAASIEADLDNGVMKPRDKVIALGVLVDKVNGFQTMSKSSKEGPTKIELHFNSGSQCGIIANPGEVPRGELPVQGDDMRPGERQDLVRLPGSDQDGS